MRRWLGLLLCLISVASFAQERAIAWEGKGAEGQTIRFDPNHRDKPAILLFWATWCPLLRSADAAFGKSIRSGGQG